MQTEAQGQLQAAEVRQKGLKKQLAEQRKALASKEKEAGGLAQDLQKEQRTVDECSHRQALSQKCLDTHLLPSIAALCLGIVHFLFGRRSSGRLMNAHRGNDCLLYCIY